MISLSLIDKQTDRQGGNNPLGGRHNKPIVPPLLPNLVVAEWKHKCTIQRSPCVQYAHETIAPPLFLVSHSRDTFDFADLNKHNWW